MGDGVGTERYLRTECAKFVKVVKGGSALCVCVCCVRVFAQHRQRVRVIFVFERSAIQSGVCVCFCFVVVWVCALALFLEWTWNTGALCHLLMNDVQKLNEICSVQKVHTRERASVRASAFTRECLPGRLCGVPGIMTE